MNFDFEYFNIDDFLEGLDGEIREKVNESFIKLYNFLITTEKYNQINFEVFCFPLIKKIVSETNVELQDPEAFCEYCLEWFLYNEDHFNKMIEHGIKIDKYALICDELAKTIVKIIKET